MAKKNDLIKAIECMAKAGVTELKFSVYPSDMELLRVDGFEVILPSHYREIPKARQEVTVSWKNATRSVAKRMRALVENHEHKSACASRDYLTSKGKAAKEVIKDFTAKRHSESLSAEDEEYYEEVAMRYEAESDEDEDFVGIDSEAFYSAEEAEEDANWVSYLASGETV